MLYLQTSLVRLIRKVVRGGWVGYRDGEMISWVGWRGSEKGGREEGVRVMGKTREDEWDEERGRIQRKWSVRGMKRGID